MTPCFPLARHSVVRRNFTRVLLCILSFVPLVSQSAGQSSPAKATPTQPPALEQPLPFSHKRHAEQQLPCGFCHTNADPGDQMGLPASNICMACHQSVATQKPSIKKLGQFAKQGQAIPWRRAYSVPGFVYWSHRVHLVAKQKCSECHGDVEKMEVIVPVEKVTTMGGCVNCHRHKEAPTGCAACHDNRSS